MGTDNTTSTGVATHVQRASLAIYCVILIVGTLGNSLVIYVTGCKMRRTVNSVWFLNLALADFLFMICLIFAIISISQEHQWQFGLVMCKLNNFLNAVTTFASIFLLTAISLDRCLSICLVVWAQNKRTVCKTQLICVIIWMTAGVCSAPIAYFRNFGEMNKKMYCFYSASIEQLWSLYIFRFVIGFLIPFMVICVSYVAISVRARRLQRTRTKRSNRIIFSVVLAFFICWLPYHVFMFIELASRKNEDLKHIAMIVGPLVVSLAFMNSCLNPILYVFLCDEFQKKLKQSICSVLESALTEDHLSFTSSRSFSSHFSRVTRKSDSSEPVERKASSCNTESQVIITGKRDTEQ
ncbi:chemokine-like receptor 1 [Cottoperca gobio]|uniref:Chemokine-like receptor 1 n=1 Tax=Cottoperca gobio TaxID=56716 RepID=A0A6J2RAN4_COTGO|nr:chemokine-like receptor 1 [Cottoperca gobio]